MIPARILVFVLGLLTGSHAVPRLHLTTTSEMAKPGDSITLTCMVTGFEPGNFVRWTKEIDDVDKPINLATNSFLENAFTKSNFEALSPKTKDNGVEFQLKIKGVTLEDEGVFKCALPTASTSLEASVPLTVIRDIATFSFIYTNGSRTQDIQDGQEIKFKNEDPLMLTCQADGSNPEPVVEITINGKPADGVTTEVDEHYRVVDKVLGKVEKWYSVSKVLNTRVSYGNADKRVECTAGLPGATENEMASRSFRIRMEGTPPEIQCASEWTAWEESDDFVILCQVAAKPPINNASITYYRNNRTEQEFLEQITTASLGRYELSIGKNSSFVAFKIMKVYRQDYRDYNIIVQNDAGRTNQIIKLIRDPSQPVLTSSAPFTAMSIILCLLVAISHLISQL